MILLQGADPHSEDDSGRSCFAAALFGGHTETARWLAREWGVDVTKPDRAGVTVGGRHFFQGRDDIVSFPVALCILRRAVSESHDDNDACVQPYYSSVAGGKLDASRVKVTSSLPQLDKHVHEVLAFPASSTSVDTTPTGQLPRHSVPLPSRERMLKRVGHACAIILATMKAIIVANRADGAVDG